MVDFSRFYISFSPQNPAIDNESMKLIPPGLCKKSNFLSFSQKNAGKCMKTMENSTIYCKKLAVEIASTPPLDDNYLASNSARKRSIRLLTNPPATGLSLSVFSVVENST